MPLNEDERKLLAELQAREAEPEADEDYEIEVYDTNAGKGARIPYRTGKSWLHQVFGIGEGPAAAGEDGPGAGPEVAPEAGTGKTGKKQQQPGGSVFSRRE